MAQSTEYPALRWVEPASWTNANRTSVQLIVIHTTEGSATDTSAEGGAAYDARRTDGTSTHYFHDSGSTVQCVRTNDIAHTARRQGNLRGIQHELCTKAGSSAATWGNAYHQAMLRRAAQQCALDARKWGIPVRHLTVAQVSGGVKGFCGHVDITRAFPQDGGTHTDPGGNFPWSQFLDMVREEIEVLDMPSPEDYAAAVAVKLYKDLSNSDSGLYDALDDHLDKRLDAALAKRRPLALARLKERGWGGTEGMSVDQMHAYLLEALVASPPADVDADGDLDSTTPQSRLQRLEDAVREIKELLTPPAQG